MKTVFFGSSKYVLPTIQMLHAEFGLGLVVTTEKDSKDTVPSYAAENNIPFISVANLKEEYVTGKIRSIGAEVGVLGYFGRIVPQELLDIFPKGIVNIHPSLLPLYRGPTPVQTAILSGDTQTGTTIIVLDKEVDNGPMLVQKKAEILSTDTTDSLHTKLFNLGAELIKDVLPKYLNGGITPQQQDHTKATFTKHLSKSDGQIDINNPPDKDKLDRMIRAYYPWPNVWTRMNFNGKEKIVKFLPTPLSLRGESETNDAAIHSKYLIQVEGGKPMSIKDFLNGYPELGEVLQKVV